jgi:prophage regulatory protein
MTSTLPNPNTYAILRLPAVLKFRGRSRSSHYADISQGLFTRQVQLGTHCIGWPEHELIALNEARIAGKNDEEIRTLVKRLEAQRKGAN